MNRDEGAYFLSHVYDPLLTSLDDRKTGSQMQRRKSLLKKSVAHDGRNCQVSVNFNPGFVWKKVYFNYNLQT